MVTLIDNKLRLLKSQENIYGYTKNKLMCVLIYHLNYLIIIYGFKKNYSIHITKDL